MIKRYCDFCGCELVGERALNGGTQQDRLVATVGRAPLEITVLLRRRHGIDMCRRCVLKDLAAWLEKERGRDA